MVVQDPILHPGASVLFVGRNGNEWVGVLKDETI